MIKLNDKKMVISGFLWRFLERTCAQGVQFIVSIVLARLLTPSEYGYVGLIIAFIAVGNVFVNAGFGNALIQKKDADDLDFSSVFFLSIFIGILLFTVMQLAAPVIAGFYGELELTGPIRLLSLMLVIAGVNSVQHAVVSKRMIFKKFFLATVIGTLFSAIVGIVLAKYGFGIWALVWQQLVNQLLDTIVLWTTLKWRPVLCFSIKRVKKLFSFGWKLLVSTLIDTVYNNMYTFVLGKTYSTEIVGYYNRGKNIPNLVITNINSSIQSVLFPAISRVQTDSEQVKKMVRRSIVTSTFLIFPCMAGLVAISRPLTIILLTEKWLPCVPFLRFCCFIYAFWPIHTANLQAINALGRSDIFLKLEVIKKIMGVAVLIITLPMGIYPMMVGRCVTTVVSAFLNAYPNKKMLNYSYQEQMKDIIPSMFLSVFMLLIMLSLNFLKVSVWVLIFLQAITGILIYVGGAKLLHLECMEYIMRIIKQVVLHIQCVKKED